MATPTSNPPEWMQSGEPSMADGARKHIEELQKKRSLFFSASPRKDKDKDKGKGKASSPDPPDLEPVDIDFKDQRKSNIEEGKVDQFKWATIYENQRGLTIFSTPYYSSRSLLPIDPSPFNVPNPRESTPSHPHHEAPPNVTLTTFPLPDPTWRWVSKSWLVDMRGDGDVQHDGFEYNWFFRRNHWRARVGWLSSGGWVRRRRWVRLMMRPSDARVQAEAAIEDRRREDVAREASDSRSQDARIWRGDSGDWDRIRKVLRALARDGPKLERWAHWLAHLIDGGALEPAHGQASTKDESKDTMLDLGDEPTMGVDLETPEQEHPSRAWITMVLREHGTDMRGLFIYPDSRAQLRDLLIRAGFAQDVVLDPTGAPEITRNQLLSPSDFWSSTSGLDLPQSTEAADRANAPAKL